MNTQEVLVSILVMGLITYSLRALPFVFAKQFLKLPMASMLGRYLPPAIMLILTLTSLHLTEWGNRYLALSEVLPLALVIALHMKWRHPLISIFGGTLLHIVLKNYFDV